MEPKDFEIMFNVSKNVFYPKPKVMSSVISIRPKKNIGINIEYKTIPLFIK